MFDKIVLKVLDIKKKIATMKVLNITVIRINTKNN